jgi:hypothetical protein
VRQSDQLAHSKGKNLQYDEKSDTSRIIIVFVHGQPIYPGLAVPIIFGTFADLASKMH